MHLKYKMLQWIVFSVKLVAVVSCFIAFNNNTFIIHTVECASVGDIVSSGYKGYKGGKKAAGFAKNVLSGLDIYTACIAAGGSEAACGGKASLCFFYKQFGKKFTKGIWQSGYAESLYRYLCLGEPVLKCCRTNGGCHSAFNDDAPINCEGNPYYGPTSTAGLCLAPCPTCPGCVCDYIPKCNTIRRRALIQSMQGGTHVLTGGSENIVNFTSLKPTPNRELQSDNGLFSRYNEPEFHLGRMNNFLVELGYLMKRKLTNNDWTKIPSINPNSGVPLKKISVFDEIMDFIRFRGCQSFAHNFEILVDGIPDLIPVNYRGDELLRPGDLIDQIPAIRQMIPYYIVARYVVDIPQFWLKIDYINSIPTNETQIQRALVNAGITSPEQVILDWIDYGGLFVLQEILGDKWKLLTVPVNQTNWNLTEIPETPDLKTCRKNNGRSSPVRIYAFKVSLAGSLCTINLSIIKGQGEIFLSTFWGDRSNLDEQTINTNVTDLLSLSHSYSKCGPRRLSIQITNAGRLRTVVLTSVNIPCNIGLPSTDPIPSYPNVANVHIQLNITFAFRALDAGKQFFLFEGASTVATALTANLTDANSTLFTDLGTYVFDGGEDLPQQANLIFPWDNDPLTLIRFTCRTINNYLYTASAAVINKVKIELMNGEMINIAFSQSPQEPILCARRGDVFEDKQVIGIVSLLKATDATVELSNFSTSEDTFFQNDGFYYETYPNRFMYSSSVEIPVTPSPNLPPPPTPTPAPIQLSTKCGIFGWSLFCPLKCGFWKRLLGLGGCRNA